MQVTHCAGGIAAAIESGVGTLPRPAGERAWNAGIYQGNVGCEKGRSHHQNALGRHGCRRKSAVKRRLNWYGGMLGGKKKEVERGLLIAGT